MRGSLSAFLAQFPVVTLFGVTGIGYLLGQIRLFGFRLGVAGVLFAGLAAGALGPDIALPSIVSTVGLILFIYSIGIQFGPNFVNPFRREGYRDNPHLLSATITRLRRGDVDIVPDSDTRLESGDRVRVLTAPANFDAVSTFFGDSIRGTAETDFASVGLGMAMGVILGLIPLPLPGGVILRLGLAGGPLIAGLVLGRLQRTGPITWIIPMSANLTLRQIGLVLFQAGLGTRAGYGFLQTVRASGFQMIASGAIITAGVAMASLFIGHRLLHQPFEKVMGLTCAIHTEPASLAFASLISNSDALRARVPGVHRGQDRAGTVISHVARVTSGVLGSTSRLTASPNRSSATSNFQDACMFIQNLDVVPKSLMRVAGTRSAIANWCAGMPRGDRNSSRRISPG